MGVSTTTSRVGRSTNGSTLAVWNLISLFAIICLGGVHVWQMSSVTQRGFQMRDLEDHVDALQLETEQLQTRIAEASSLAQVSERMQILGFVEPSNIVYVNSLDSLAVR